MSVANKLLSEVYFHELETRDRISSRLQINIAVYASFFTVTAYMLRMMDYSSHPVGLTLFYASVSFVFLFIVQSGYKTATSLTGFEYRTLPKAIEVLNFRDGLERVKVQRIEYNEKYGMNYPVPNPEGDTDSFLAAITARCIDYNHEVNEMRRVGTKLSTKYIINALFPLAVATGVFVAFDLDASSPRKNLLTQDTSLSEQVKLVNENLAALERVKIQKGETMSGAEKDTGSRDNTPPPPPPALPTEPVWQVSTEDFKVKLPDKSDFLKEHK